MIKFKRVFVLLIVVVSMLVVTASAEWTTTDRNYLSSVKTDIATIKSSCSTLVTKTTSVDTRLSSINDKLTTTNSHLANVVAYTNSMNTKLGTIGTSIDNIEIYTKWIIDCYNRLGDVITGINTTNGHLEYTNSYLSDIHEVIASEEDMALKEETKDDTVKATEVMSSVDSASNVSSLGDFQSSFVDYFTLDTESPNYSEMFTYLDEGTTTWFSSTTALSLYKGGGQVMTSGVMAAAYEEPETPLLDARTQAVKDYFGWGDD